MLCRGTRAQFLRTAMSSSTQREKKFRRVVPEDVCPFLSHSETHEHQKTCIPANWAAVRLPMSME